VTDLIDMCQKIRNNKLSFVLNPDSIWDSFNNKFDSIVNCTWQEVKFLDDTSKELHSSMNSIPSNCGGIYVFVVKTNIIPNTHLYTLYIGRVKITDNQNLKRRCKQYLKDTRPKILFMRETWGKNLYIRYLPLMDNNTIEELEEELIRVVIPPCNTDYPETINSAMKAAF
jgi:hypothetical protein